MANTKHQDRVNKELLQAGVHPLELYRHMFKLVPGLIRSNEHIEAVAYGLSPNMWHGALIATDRRILYVEADLVFSTIDELPYEIVHGTERVHAPLRVGVKLTSRASDYSLKYVNKQCAERFVAYIEDRVEKMDDLASGYAAPHDPIRRTNKKAHAFVSPKGLPDLPLAHIYDVQRDFLRDNHVLTITHKSLQNRKTTAVLRYHMHDDALFAVADRDISKVFDIKQVLPAIVEDRTGRTMQLEVILKIEMNPTLLSLGLGADGKVAGSSVYRLQIVDLAFVASK